MVCEGDVKEWRRDGHSLTFSSVPPRPFARSNRPEPGPLVTPFATLTSFLVSLVRKWRVTGRSFALFGRFFRPLSLRRVLRSSSHSSLARSLVSRSRWSLPSSFPSLVRRGSTGAGSWGDDERSRSGRRSVRRSVSLAHGPSLRGTGPTALLSSHFVHLVRSVSLVRKRDRRERMTDEMTRDRERWSEEWRGLSLTFHPTSPHFSPLFTLRHPPRSSASGRPFGRHERRWNERKVKMCDEKGKTLIHILLLYRSLRSLRSLHSPKDRMFTRVFPHSSSRPHVGLSGSLRSPFVPSSRTRHGVARREVGKKGKER